MLDDEIIREAEVQAVREAAYCFPGSVTEGARDETPRIVD
jgi:hypothetical protein